MCIRDRAQALELLQALDEPALYTELLQGCRQLPGGGLRGNRLFPGGAWKRDFTSHHLYDLLVLISLAPAQAAVHPSLRRSEITTLRLRCAPPLQLPSVIDNLPALTRLNVSHKELPTLPDAVGRLAGLHILDVRYNRLSVLPTVVGSLRSLRTLLLDFNPLQQVTDVIGGVSMLRELSLTSTSISWLPEAMQSLERLERLDLARCQALTSLPEWVWRLPSLKHLSLRSTRLRPTIRQIADAPRLEILELNRRLFRNLQRTRTEIQEVRPKLVLRI